MTDAQRRNRLREFLARPNIRRVVIEPRMPTRKTREMQAIVEARPTR